MRDELSGALRERAVHLIPGGRDAAGAPEEFTEGETLWASLVPIAARANERGERRSAAERWAVTVRADAAVERGHRLRWRGADYDVVNVTADPRRPARLEIIMERLA